MNPAWSFTSTGVLPHASAKARASAMVSSLAVRGRTISTRAITGAGLKKWTPHTLSGRPVSMASSITGQRRGVGGQDGAVLADAVELVEQVLLGGQVLDDRLDDEVAVGQLAEVGRGRDPAEGGLAVLVGRACPSRPAWPATSRGRPPWRRPSPAAGAQHHLVAGLGRHLGDARAHDPRPDDAHALDRHGREVTDEG